MLIELYYNELFKLSFPDVLVERIESSNFQEMLTSVYCKTTISGQYLNFKSINLAHKITVVRTLIRNAETYCNTDAVLQCKKKKIFFE